VQGWLLTASLQILGACMQKVVLDADWQASGKCKSYSCYLDAPEEAHQPLA
jgi:hypothetical protein